jgi:hypothetical protein
MKTDSSPLDYFFLALKAVIAMLILKTVLTVLGFTGYIPVVDEVYNVTLRPIFSAGGMSIVPASPQ